MGQCSVHHRMPRALLASGDEISVQCSVFLMCFAKKLPLPEKSLQQQKHLSHGPVFSASQDAPCAAIMLTLARSYHAYLVGDIYMRMHTHTRTHTCACTRTHTHTHTHMHMHCTTYTRTYIHTCTHTRMHGQMCCMHVQTHIHVYVAYPSATNNVVSASRLPICMYLFVFACNT